MPTPQDKYLSQLFAEASDFHRRGQLAQAEAIVRQILDVQPNVAEVHFKLGNILKDRSQWEAASAAYRAAIHFKPDYSKAHGNLGNVLAQIGQLDDAIAAYRTAIQLQPDYAQVYSNLGMALKGQGHLEEAIAACRTAVQLKPDLAEVHINLGVALKSAGQLDQALVACRTAVELGPTLGEAHCNLADVLRQRGELDAAIEAYNTAISLRPNFAQAHGNLAVALGAQARHDESIASHRAAVALNPALPNLHSAMIFSMHYDPSADAKSIARELRTWNFRHAEPLSASIQPHANDCDPNRRLRIGYVSPDFKDHPVGRFLLPLLAHHDKSKFEIFAYAQAPIPDSMTQQLRSFIDAWRDIAPLSDARAANLIRQDRIDILVDLAMHTAHHRLLVFARKPAPVQVTWLGYPGSTGMTAIDYRLSDRFLDPPDSDESIYTEQTIRLPDSFWCYDPLRGRDVPINDLPALTNNVVTFGCLNNFFKTNDAVLRLWSRILSAVPYSRLRLMAPEGSTRQRTLDLFTRGNIRSDRIEFVSNRLPHVRYLEQYHQIDLALDTFPYNGHTTSCDALWMGVPVVTLVGATGVGRGGLSILSNVGLPELAARSHDEYLKIAISLAHDLPKLAHLRSQLRQSMIASPLMDAPKFARGIESAYRAIWQRLCEKRH